MNRWAAAGTLLTLCAVLHAGCADNVAQLCPPGSKPAGSFSVALTFQAGRADECRVIAAADGGAIDASLATTPSPRDSALCFADGDAGPILYLALSDSVRASPLGDGGSFTFTSSTQVEKSACSCPLNVDETISGQLAGSGDGGVVYSSDGGLSPIRGFSGVVADAVSSPDGGPPCRCNVPCALRYDLAGTKQ
ncbi:MAG: hypothetical protein NVS2B9_14010 [Myxococcales bacterium]